MRRARTRLPVYLLLISTLGGVSGCASMADLGSSDAASAGAPVVTIPATPEEQVLGLLDRVASGESVALMDGARAQADQAYAAASGRRCRWVTLTYPADKAARRLACAVAGSWRWVTAVTADLSR